MERLKDPEERAKIKHDILHERDKHHSPPGFLLADGHADKIWVLGKSLAEHAAERNTNAVEAAFDLLIENGGSFPIVAEQHFEEDIRKLIVHPLTIIESDGRITKLGDGRPHPRSYGVFPLVFRKDVRGETRLEEPKEVGKKILTLEEAIRKMTSLPGLKLGIEDRGSCAKICGPISSSLIPIPSRIERLMPILTSTPPGCPM